MAWNTLSRKLTWFNRPQRIPSTKEAIELHNLESRRIIRKYNDRNLFEEGNVRQWVAHTHRGGDLVTHGVPTDMVGGDELTRIRPGHFVTALRPMQNATLFKSLELGQQFTQFTSVEHHDGFITRIFDSVTQAVDDDDGVAISALRALSHAQGASGAEADVYTPVWVAQEPQEFAGGRTIMHEYYPGERLIFIIPRRGVWLQVRVHNGITGALMEGDFVKVTKVGTVMKADNDDGAKIVGIVRQGIEAVKMPATSFGTEAAKLSDSAPRYDARLVTIEIV